MYILQYAEISTFVRICAYTQNVSLTTKPGQSHGKFFAPRRMERDGCWGALTLERLSTAYFFPANDREGHVTWHFPRLLFAGRRFYLRRTFLPFGGNVKTWVFCSPFTVYFSTLIACFYSYASFIILLLHELLVKLKEFQIQAENT